MESLTDLISREFERAGYRSIGSFLWKHESFEDYWIVINNEGNFDLNNLQNHLYSDLSEMRKQSPEIEKNTSLLILNLVNAEEKSRERVIAAENDVYVFKKYVIQYTQEEWESVKGELSNDDMIFSDLLMDVNVFSELKKDPDGAFGLLYAVAHKLPFVTLNVTKKDYDVSEVLDVPERMMEMLEWLDNVPKWERKTPSEAEIDAVRKDIEHQIAEEIANTNEDRTVTTA